MRGYNAEINKMLHTFAYLLRELEENVFFAHTPVKFFCKITDKVYMISLGRFLAKNESAIIDKSQDMLIISYYCLYSKSHGKYEDSKCPLFSLKIIFIEVEMFMVIVELAFTLRTLAKHPIVLAESIKKNNLKFSDREMYLYGPLEFTVYTVQATCA